MKRLLLAFFLCSLPCFAEEQPILLTVFPLQADSPVWVVGSRQLPDGTIGEFQIENRSERSVSRIRLGWLVRQCQSLARLDMENCYKEPAALLGISDSFDKLLPAGEVKTAKVSVTNYRSIVGKLRAKQLDLTRPFAIEVGVVFVVFEDGSEWEYDLVNEREWRWEELSILNRPLVLASLVRGRLVLVQVACGEARSNDCCWPHNPYVACCEFPNACSTSLCRKQCIQPAELENRECQRKFQLATAVRAKDSAAAPSSGTEPLGL